ncbi:hypothetical protein MUK42_16005 [Musa troglodytarum]|uniref:Uncharacterized protein n=1 Tax=Musa troglodytarum TaxID=320322 RepID=A0A9E7H369_9LILI|nr:hypothetical protein MUK42_16005 [Musa troglodytarum]
MEVVSSQSPDAAGHQVVRQCASEAWMRERDEELREAVRRMFRDNKDVTQTMHLIDTIQLLGLDYHFEEEITQALKRVYDADSANDGLYEVSLRFRLLRERGYSVTSDVFNKFKDEGGSFSSALTDDVKGLLSLYNAAYLGTHGETILDEAISFTRSHLTSMVHDLNPPLATLVSLALETPLRRSIKRLFARHYISIYQEEPTRNDEILELKLDFHMLQSLHPLTKTLSFARERVVEAYYWILGVYYEPQFSRARVMAAKIVIFTTLLDDIYDDYSTLEESQLLTDAIQRWEFEAVDQLPEYLKDFFLKLLITVQELETELAAEEKFRIFYLKEALKSQAGAYFEESRWRDETYAPTLEEHLGVSTMSSACPLFASAILVGMGEVATKEAFEWAASFPKIVEASAVIARIMNDITSYEREGKREHVVSTVHCCMKEYGTSIDDACKKLQEMVEDAWKDINQECLDPTTFLAPLLQTLLYFTRISENVYKYTDAYTESHTRMRECISLLLVHPVVSSQPPDAAGHQVVRQCAVYHPDVWGDYFITHQPCSDETQAQAWVRERDEELREAVRRMFQDNNDVMQTMHLIDTIQLLGLDYHFEEEITEALKRVYDADSANHGLYEVSLRFRLLREKGYSVTSDVFDKFKDEGGSFSSALTDDVKGLLSLYNAAYLGTHGETILDEAISFTRSHLTSMVHDLNPPLATLVSLALETPLRRSIKRLFARHYISIYQEEPTRNDEILELAKLDFHMLQSLHRGGRI